MRSPRLAPSSVPAPLARRLGHPDVRAFEVLDDGDIAGRPVRRGDAVLCRAEPADGHAVLVPRGHGRAIVGEVRGRELRGAWGEPCHPERWTCAGALIACARRVGSAWQLEELFTPQLPLFAAA